MYTSYTTIKTLDVLNRIKYPIFVFFSKTLLENPPPLKKFKASDTRKQTIDGALHNEDIPYHMSTSFICTYTHTKC